MSVTLFISCVNKKNSSIYNYSRNSSTDLMTFGSSDSGMNNFLNGYFKRNIGVDGMNVYRLKLGESAWFAKEWESMSLNWFETPSSIYDTNRFETVTSYIDNNPQDKYGYVWNGIYHIEAPNEPNLGRFSQGWPFPYGGTNNGNTHYSEYIPEYEFNTNDNDQDKGFASFGVDERDIWKYKIDSSRKDVRDEEVAKEEGLLKIKAHNASEIRFESPDLNISPFIAPFLHMDIRIADQKAIGNSSNIEDIYIEFKISDDNTVYSVSQKDFNTIPQSISGLYMQDAYYPMYLHEKWNADYEAYDGNVNRNKESAKRITNVNVVVKAKPGKTISGDVQMNYLRFEADKRQVNNQSILINSLATMYEFTKDINLLKQNITRARKAMQFYLTHLDGATSKNGLINTKWLIGHDGERTEGMGIGDGYWDIQLQSSTSAYANIYYYRALKSMINIELACEELKLNFQKPSIMGKDNKTLSVYTETSQTLIEKAEKVANSFNNYFYNEDTGRFHNGYMIDGSVIDYGSTITNLESIASGLGTDEQARSIMDWISGKRIVEGDNFTGKQIYKHEFAPVINTKDNGEFLFWPFEPIEYSKQVQNGGTVSFMAYYDIVARMRVYGSDDAFSRLKAIQGWYDKVEKAGGQGEMFFSTYYENLQELVLLEGWNGNGEIGIDQVFMESAIITSVIPNSFVGISSNSSNLLKVKPNMPKNLDYLKMENCTFNKATYDISVGKSFVQLNSVRNTKNDLKVEVSLLKPSGSFTVKYNNQEITNFKVVGNYIITTIPLKNGKIVII